MTDTRHLDTAISILKNDGKAKRAKAKYTFNWMGDHAIVQGTRGQTVATLTGDKADCVRQAKARYGAELAVYE